MVYRITSELIFPTEWTESERMAFASTGVSNAEWFAGDLLTGDRDLLTVERQVFATSSDVNAAMNDLLAVYKGQDRNGVGVKLRIEWF